MLCALILPEVVCVIFVPADAAAAYLALHSPSFRQCFVPLPESAKNGLNEIGHALDEAVESGEASRPDRDSASSTAVVDSMPTGGPTGRLNFDMCPGESGCGRPLSDYVGSGSGRPPSSRDAAKGVLPSDMHTSSDAARGSLLCNSSEFATVDKHRAKLPRIRKSECGAMVLKPMHDGMPGSKSLVEKERGRPSECRMSPGLETGASWSGASDARWVACSSPGNELPLHGRVDESAPGSRPERGAFHKDSGNIRFGQRSQQDKSSANQTDKAPGSGGWNAHARGSNGKPASRKEDQHAQEENLCARSARLVPGTRVMFADLVNNPEYNGM